MTTKARRRAAWAKPTGPKVPVLFLDGIPIGRRAVFEHDDQLWMAFPIDKTHRVLRHGQRAVELAYRAHRLLLMCLAAHPDWYPDLRLTLEALDRVHGTPPWTVDRPDDVAAVEPSEPNKGTTHA
ncbi:hypothetical protein SEA_AYOTOYA_53 [Gordonia phage Ayotoya]|nr:hypothetical protein SEA_AYOTOYA_53 [Gordonia phage Ayotoya]URP21280.1 hypothetical protein SEA_CHOP_53 [Gordonia phage Chop]UXL91328.1 hypothetical protein SEA_GRANDSLAM_53 [Gordonia phage GrandSlam]